MKIDFLLAASPNDAFYSQIAFFRMALDALGGIYRRARVVAVFGDNSISALPPGWAPYFRNIDVAWTDPEDFKLKGYPSQGDRRYEVFRPDADLVIFSDADTVIMRSFTWTIARLILTQSLAGVIAHFHFPWPQSTGDSAQDWSIISKAVLGRDIPMTHRYKAQKPAEAGLCPFYVNYGFFAGPPRIMSRLYERYREIRPKVTEILGNVFCGQVALALAAYDLGLGTTALPVRFNYQNLPLTDELYPRDLRSIVTLHYLNREHFDRHIIFVNADHMADFLNLRLTGSSRVFQKFVKKLTGGQYPFERS